MRALATDYLVVGAGAAGMAFADSLIAESDTEVLIVDRRHRPGGHWNDAYPFVRLHQPSAFYGVNSRVLGRDTIDEDGPNAGLYERASGLEVCDYYQRVLEEHLLASGRVRFLGMCDYLGGRAADHQLASRLTGETSAVHVRSKVVDATYLETSVPATHQRSFGVDPGARVISINGLVAVPEPGSGFTVIGGGKTAIDACLWLLDNGVAPEGIRWIRPRDAWYLDRAYQQPLQLVTWLLEGVSLYLEAAAEAETVDDLFDRLEGCGQLVRLDPDVQPTMYRCATVSDGELAALRRIDDIVRLGRVRHVGTDRIVLEEGSIPTDPGQVHVDCSAIGLRATEGRPIFDGDRITLQQVRACQPTFNAALLAYVEANRDDDAAKNRLCPPNPYPSAAVDWIGGTYIAQRAQARWYGEADLMDWMERSRLNGARGAADHMADPRMQSAVARLFANTEPAIANLKKLQATLP